MKPTTTRSGYNNPGDAARSAFLQALDAAPFEVTDWEARFIESNMHRAIFSDAQRLKIDQMRKAYEHRL